jgi:branched-chain amino acid transport system ATP-binding protein
MKTLEAVAMTTGYGATEIVRDVSLCAREGELTCVFGPNGSGKSTLLKTIAGAHAPWAGDIRYGGESIRDQLTEERIGSGIATMPQHGSVFPDLTIDENLRMAGYAIRDKAALNRQVEQAFERMPELKRVRGLKGSALSGGQRMQLSVAQLLMTDPEFVLLDEPSAGLSPALVKDVFRMLERLKQEGKGVLMVEQNVKDALTVADRICVLVQGEVA